MCGILVVTLGGSAVTLGGSTMGLFCVMGIFISSFVVSGASGVSFFIIICSTLVWNRDSNWFIFFRKSWLGNKYKLLFLIAEARSWAAVASYSSKDILGFLKGLESDYLKVSAIVIPLVFGMYTSTHL